MSNSVLHELFSPEAVLAEMLRVLKLGGWVIIDFRDTRISRLIVDLIDALDHLALMNWKIYSPKEV